MFDNQVDYYNNILQKAVNAERQLTKHSNNKDFSIPSKL